MYYTLWRSDHSGFVLTSLNIDRENPEKYKG